MKDSGEIYILKNAWMRGIYKIGLARTGVENRIKSLSNTSVPGQFECVASYESDHIMQLEKYIHRKLRGVRCNSNREFFMFHDDAIASESVSTAIKSFIPKDYTEREKKAASREINDSSPSRQAKASGLKSLSRVSEMTKKPVQTLINWHRDSPELFAIVIAGCKSIIDANGKDEQ